MCINNKNLIAMRQEIIDYINAQLSKIIDENNTEELYDFCCNHLECCPVIACNAVKSCEDCNVKFTDMGTADTNTSRCDDVMLRVFST